MSQQDNSPTIAERLSAPPKQKPGKRCGDALPKKAASPEMPHGKKTYQAPSTGFVAPGDGQIGKPKDAVLSPSPTRAHIKVSGKNNQPEAARIIGSPDKMMASAERVRQMQGHPKGKTPGSPDKRASNFSSTGYLDETQSSARRKAKIDQERIDFPSKPRKQNPWEKPGLNPTLAMRVHLGHGVGVTNAIHGSSPSGDVVTQEEIDRNMHTGGAGRSANTSPKRIDDGDILHQHGKKQPTLAARAIDHVAAEAFNKEQSPDKPHIPAPLDFSKLNFGKKTKISTEKKSPQAQRRQDNQFHVSKKKDKTLQFSARRVHQAQGSNALLRGYGSMTAIVSARAKPTGRGHCGTAVARKQNLNFRDPNSMVMDTGAKPKMMKNFNTAQKATSFDNDFARANHKNSTAADKVDSATAQNLIKHEARPGRRIQAEKKNSSLKGVLNPETPRLRKLTVSARPFGDHDNQELSLKKSASPARIGWHGAAQTV